MRNKRKIAVFTGTRADFGLLLPLLKELRNSETVDLRLIATGSHMSEEHGFTISEINSAGFKPSVEIPIWSGDESPLGAAADFGKAVNSFSKTLSEMKPDCIVLLGDRLEALAMSISAVILQVPIAHIYGGDVTVGAMDDSVRHAITQLSTLHFPANEISFNRLLAMGVAVENTFNYGSPLLDTLESLDSLSPEELTRRFGINFGRITAMLTFHPAAYEIMAPLQILEVLFEALESMGNLNVIITGTNSDIGSRAVREAIAGFVVKNQGRVTYVESMGHQAYLSALKHVDVVIGNSSSIVLEAPLLGTPSILLGNRQDGRPLVDSVLTPEVTPASIREAIEKSLDREFIGNLGKIKSTFGIAGFAKKTAAKLASHIFERANQ